MRRRRSVATSANSPAESKRSRISCWHSAGARAGRGTRLVLSSRADPWRREHVEKEIPRLPADLRRLLDATQRHEPCFETSRGSLDATGFGGKLYFIHHDPTGLSRVHDELCLATWDWYGKMISK